MQNKENTSLSHFGRLRKKADRITAAAILSSTFNINAGCESDPAPKEDNTSELESKLAKVKEEAKQKEDTLKGQISTLESEKTTLEGEKTTKTTAINNLIGFVNALGGKQLATGGTVANGKAGLHGQNDISESNCSTAHTVAGSLNTIYEDLRLLNTNTANQELLTLRNAISLMYSDTDVTAAYNSGTTSVNSLGNPASYDSASVASLLAHVKGLINSLKAEKNEYSSALVAIEGKLNITPATGTKVDQRATDCNTAITALENIYTKVVTDFNSVTANTALHFSPVPNDEAGCKTAVTARLKTQAGTPYDTVVTALNASSPGLNCGITATATATGGSTTPTDDDYKTALTGYVGNLKGIYDKIPGANAADKNTYLDNLKGLLNLIVKIYNPTSPGAVLGTADLIALESAPATSMTNTITKLVTDVTNSRASLEYLYDTILAPAPADVANTQTLGAILTAIQTEGTTNKTIGALKNLGVDFLTKVQTYVTDKTLLVKTGGGGGGGSYTNADIPMSVLNTKLTTALDTTGTGNGLLEEASFYQLSANLLSLTKKLTPTEAGEVSTTLTTSWSLGTATASDEKTSRENLLNTFVASRTQVPGPAFLADNHQTVLDFIASFNKCNSTDKLTFVKEVIAKIKNDALAV